MVQENKKEDIKNNIENNINNNDNNENVLKNSGILDELFLNLPYNYKITNKAAQIKQNFDNFKDKKVQIAGRITAIRKSGKLIFADILDSSEKIQAYFDFNLLNERFDKVKSFNIGDIIGVSGIVFKTNPGEISIKVEDYALLSKALRALPNKYKGLVDIETRYRKRYLDLIMSNDSKNVFIKRSNIIQFIRDFLYKKEFIEFETPAIQPFYGGADADPFKVFVNTLNEEDYLRISNELYLKRLIIGGFDKVFEIYKAFRNEDIDVTHSPEFTMIELYQAFSDYNDIMQLTEDLLIHVTNNILNSDSFVYQENTIKMKFNKIYFVDSVNQKLNIDLLNESDEKLIMLLEQENVKIPKNKIYRAHLYEKIFETFIQKDLVQPTFVIDFPKETSFLCREKRNNSKLAERFELYVSGIEIANAYSELNNPIIQKSNFEKEMKINQNKNIDMDFIEAMEYGMPPTGGLGIGIDRLVMLLTNKQSIKEVIMFPMEKKF
ncbi:MAG: lysine--tRNA ligase [Candidatus Marsarchaeota archaeon]|nr:lysine--tRNA ligase [Candidatus Marsarchaeota archaeon]MCL5094873.1 lysine--tRNA ligase [Candidatus Marsarchaeota archaeon]